MPPRNFNVILFALIASVLCHVTYRKTRTADMLGEAIALIEQKYVDPVEREQLVRAAMEGVVGKLDEHSGYFAVDAYSSFQDSMHQEFAGIGIYVDQPDDESPVRVVTPLVNSPALRAGLLPGDEIVRVDGEDVSSLDLAAVSERLKGPPGTQVSIGIRRDEETLSMTVRRETIELESIVGDHRDAENRWVYRLKGAPSVAYIRVKSFGEKTVRELESILKQFDNDFAALVLDLRGNGGGLLYAARDVCDMFLSSGQIVSTRSRDDRLEESYAATPGTLVDPDKPLAILIDRDSASASEIVAACLQDNRRALIAGTRSYGKGTVQEIMPLQYGRSALRLTVARYYRPNNHNIHRAADATEEDEWGVKPDEGFVIPMDAEALVQLRLRWREASFPMLAGVEPPELEAAPRPVAPLERGESPTAPAKPGESLEMPGAVNSPGQAADPTRAPVTPIGEQTRSAQPVELSEQARQNVRRGPESLATDPPLRAAVGHLLQAAKAAR